MESAASLSTLIDSNESVHFGATDRAHDALFEEFDIGLGHAGDAASFLSDFDLGKHLRFDSPGAI